MTVETTREEHERVARLNAALAAEQARTYWLDRWHLDLDAVMRRRDARAVFGVLRALHRSIRTTRQAARAARGAVGAAREPRVAAAEPVAPGFAVPGPAAGPVTDVLFDRLAPEDLAEVERRLAPVDQSAWQAAKGLERKRLVLALAGRYGVESALEHAGLGDAEVPLAAAGYARADAIAAALAEGGLEFAAPLRLVDLGGSAVTALLSALPGVTAIAGEPPFDREAGPVDGAYAALAPLQLPPDALGRWLDDVHGLLRVGGVLALWAPGHAALAYDAPSRSREIAEELHRSGAWFEVELNSAAAGLHCGTAYLTPEWLLARLTPAWQLLLLRPGGGEGARDVYVFRRP
jgi:hypothetical protein